MTKTYDNIPTIFAEPVDDVPPVPTTNLKLPNMRIAPIKEMQLARLVEQGYTRGLAESLDKTKQEFAQRVSITFHLFDFCFFPMEMC